MKKRINKIYEVIFYVILVVIVVVLLYSHYNVLVEAGKADSIEVWKEKIIMKAEQRLEEFRDSVTTIDDEGNESFN